MPGTNGHQQTFMLRALAWSLEQQGDDVSVCVGQQPQLICPQALLLGVRVTIPAKCGQTILCIKVQLLQHT